MRRGLGRPADLRRGLGRGRERRGCARQEPRAGLPVAFLRPAARGEKWETPVSTGCAWASRPIAGAQGSSGERFADAGGSDCPPTCVGGSDGATATVDAIQRRIDRLVYELYELTEEEIGIVEEMANC